CTRGLNWVLDYW
nr:immunoglobulin heavy chain junction region [Mus musculus]MBK4195132.1 immunoglobulin heavy chain junction region [Mus musculus]